MINSKQRAFLRKLSNPLENTFQIGKSGLSSQIAQQYDEILTAREIVKTNVLKTCEKSPEEAAKFIAEAVNADVVQVVGRKFVLYRKSEKLVKEGKSIVLPW
ncbi:MAG: YhbY family RNA-binding protein [Saccharofermentanales bacterium]